MRIELRIGVFLVGNIFLMVNIFIMDNIFVNLSDFFELELGNLFVDIMNVEYLL